MEGIPGGQALINRIAQLEQRAQEAAQLRVQLNDQAEMIEQLANANAGRERNILKPPQFSDEKNEVPYQVWEKNFQEVVAVNNWTQETARRAAKACLKGKAATRAFDLDPSEYITLAAFLEALQQRFLPKSRANLAKCHFETCTQRPNESIGDWHSRAKILYIHQDPTANINSSELIRRFIGGLYQRKEIMKAVFRANPQTYDEALQMAEDGEAADKQCEYYSTSTQNPTPYPGIEPMEIGAIQPRQGRLVAECIACGRQGHDANNCWSIPRMRKFFEEYGTPRPRDNTRTQMGNNSANKGMFDKQMGPQNAPTRNSFGTRNQGFPKRPFANKRLDTKQGRINALLAALANEAEDDDDDYDTRASDNMLEDVEEQGDIMAHAENFEDPKNVG